MFTKKKLISFALLGMLLIPTVAFAQSGTFETIGETSGLGSNSIFVIIGRIIQVLLATLGIVLLGLVIYSGILWMSAGGNPEKVEKAKQTLIRAVIGLLIVFASLAIATFIMNALGIGGLFGDNDPNRNGPPVPPFSNSLGNGGIIDHYPTRDQINVPRNTRILVTFRGIVSPEEFIEGYDDGGTASDLSDDTLDGAPITDGTFLPLDDSAVKIFRSDEGEGGAFSSPQVRVGISIIDSDVARNSTFVFSPPVLDGLVDYDVSLRNVVDETGDSLLTDNRYDWTFSTSDQLDLTPPVVVNAIPVSRPTAYARNIAIQVTFNEAMDPASASGIYIPSEGGNFTNIEVEANDSGSPIEGVFAMSNNYRTITYLTNDLCGTNSCGQDIFCLPPLSMIDVLLKSPTPADIDAAPTVPATPYPPLGVTDVVGNALDSNADGSITSDEPDYTWQFRTNNEIEWRPPVLQGIQPNIREGNVNLDVPINLTFSPEERSRLLASSLIPGESILLTPFPEHELGFRIALNQGESQDAASLIHGVLLASSEEQRYNYAVLATEGVKSQYQNCFAPAAGPADGGGRCEPTDTEPYCCNGILQATACMTRPSL